MAVTEIVQGIGQWSINLKDGTPESIRERLDFLGHVHVTRSRLDADLLGRPNLLYPGRDTFPAAQEEFWYDVWRDDDLWALDTLGDYPTSGPFAAAAAFTGVVVRIPRGDQRGLAGYGLAWWLGSGDRGPVVEQRTRFLNAGPAELLRRLLPLTVRPGRTFDTEARFTGTVEQHQPVREAVDHVLSTVGCEWRPGTDGTLDAGPPAALYGTGLLFTSPALFPSASLFPRKWAPTAVAVRRDVGWDLDLEALRVSSLALDSDVEDWASDVLLLGRGEESEPTIGRASRSDVPYRNIHGDHARRTLLAQESATEDLTAEQRAVMLLSETKPTRHAVTLSVDDYDIDGDAKVGNLIGVYDPEEGLFDLDNPQQWRGHTIYPIELRVTEASWSVTKGMGVYYRDPQGRIVDLTDHVETGAGSTRLTVGATSRSFVGLDRQTEALRQRLRSGPLYMEQQPPGLPTPPMSEE
ncbi:MAG: hypothetical protein GEU78_14475 [Actinobacteria bacterium]|nr:hypothetical protein [Actinomycetota bacterium]